MTTEPRTTCLIRNCPEPKRAHLWTEQPARLQQWPRDHVCPPDVSLFDLIWDQLLGPSSCCREVTEVRWTPPSLVSRCSQMVTGGGDAEEVGRSLLCWAGVAAGVTWCFRGFSTLTFVACRLWTSIIRECEKLAAEFNRLTCSSCRRLRKWRH